MLVLLLEPACLDVLPAGSAHDAEGDEHDVSAGVGQVPHVGVVLLACRVAYPGCE